LLLSLAKLSASTIMYWDNCAVAQGGGCASPGAACNGATGSSFLYPWGPETPITGYCVNDNGEFGSEVSGCVC
jgi:hypothetical protein